MSPASGNYSNFLELALDRNVCYPMETVSLFLRVRLETPSKPLLCVHIPQKVEIEFIHMDGIDDNSLSVYTKTFDGKLLVIPLNKYLGLGGLAEITIKLQLNTIAMNHYMTFSAWMAAEIPDTKGFFTMPKKSCAIDLAVKSSAEYLRFLPELYSYDDFTNRFLMMFESFWKPVNQQISQIENYFDPNLTPDSFLNWLASWVGMEIDDTFPKERIRLLIRNAIPFFHSRGTAQSLKLFLEMYSGGVVEVSERKAHNMVLGGAMGLGDGLALGMENKPNTVLVDMTVSASELERTGFSKDKYAKKINEFIRSIVPAHTVFSLSCKFK